MKAKRYRRPDTEAKSSELHPPSNRHPIDRPTAQAALSCDAHHDTTGHNALPQKPRTRMTAGNHRSSYRLTCFIATRKFGF